MSEQALERKAAGNKSFASGNYDDAIRLYDEALEADPTLTACHSNKTLCFAKKLAWPSVIESARAAIAAEPKNAVKARFHLVRAQLELGQLPNAHKDLTEALDMHPHEKQFVDLRLVLETKTPGPNTFAVARHKGMELYNKRQFPEAAEEFSKAAANSAGVSLTEATEVFQTLARAQLQSRNAEGARKSFEQLLKRQESGKANNIDLSTTCNNLGLCCKQLGKMGDATEWLKKALHYGIYGYGEQSPELAMIYSNLGQAQRAQKNFKESIECYSRCAELRVLRFGNEHAILALSYLCLGRSHRDAGDLSKAIDFLKMASDLWSNRSDDEIQKECPEMPNIERVSRTRHEIDHELAEVLVARQDLHGALEATKRVRTIVDKGSFPPEMRIDAILRHADLLSRIGVKEGPVESHAEALALIDEAEALKVEKATQAIRHARFQVQDQWGTMYFDAEKLTEAMECWKPFSSTDPDSKEDAARFYVSCLKVAAAHEKMGENEEAERLKTKASEVAKKHVLPEGPVLTGTS